MGEGGGAGVQHYMQRLLLLCNIGCTSKDGTAMAVVNPINMQVEQC